MFSTGKSTLGQIMTAIYGPDHTFSAADPELIIGSFTGHLHRKQVLIAEEAFFAGDHKATRRSKDPITNPMLTIHPKGLTPFDVPNLLRIIMTANDEHVLNMGAGERRWFVLEASSEFADNKPFFKSLRDHRRTPLGL